MRLGVPEFLAKTKRPVEGKKCNIFSNYRFPKGQIKNQTCDACQRIYF